MSTFQSILDQALSSKGTGYKVPAAVKSSIDAKGLSLKATLELRLKNEGDVAEEDIDKVAFEAASRRIDDILSDIMSRDILDGKFFTKTIRTKKTGSVDVPAIPGLRGVDGKFMSAANLARLLNLTLFTAVKEAMGTPALVNRTGRFAHSVHVTSLDFMKRTSSAQQNKASIFFSYMLLPYQVFESNANRSPTKLIKIALDDALRKALHPSSFKQTNFNPEGP